MNIRLCNVLILYLCTLFLVQGGKWTGYGLIRSDFLTFDISKRGLRSLICCSIINIFCWWSTCHVYKNLPLSALLHHKIPPHLVTEYFILISPTMTNMPQTRSLFQICVKQTSVLFSFFSNATCCLLTIGNKTKDVQDFQ